MLPVRALAALSLYTRQLFGRGRLCEGGAKERGKMNERGQGEKQPALDKLGIPTQHTILPNLSQLGSADSR